MSTPHPLTSIARWVTDPMSTYGTLMTCAALARRHGYADLANALSTCNRNGRGAVRVEWEKVMGGAAA